mgnify:CR=1 FL=1
MTPSLVAAAVKLPSLASSASDTCTGVHLIGRPLGFVTFFFSVVIFRNQTIKLITPDSRPGRRMLSVPQIVQMEKSIFAFLLYAKPGKLYL